MRSDVLSDVIRKLARREDLSAEEAERAFLEVMEGRGTDAQKAALLVGLRVKGETADEIAGGVRALRQAMIRVPVARADAAVDTCGTGGGGLTTFNISTGAAFVVAGGGVPVAKHGNRSFSSRCGSADVLEALGIPIDLTPPQMADVLDRAGIAFLFAPALHPAMRHLGPVRRELAIPTILNRLGPLTNPAGVRRHLVGVAEPRLQRLIGDALASLGHLRALVVHGEPGMDELSPLGVTEIVEVDGGRVRQTRFDAPRALGWSDPREAELAGGDPAHNADVIERVLSGQLRGTARQAIALNAAAGFFVAGVVDSLEEGVQRAERVLDDGAAYGTLQTLREASREAAGRRTADASG
ncbi:MAG: anthranilate phosphoribosyltransferase [Gemmatimonadota bacterium]